MSLFLPLKSFAQSSVSCWVTKIGTPSEEAVLPFPCRGAEDINGLIYPQPLTKHPTRAGYYQLPPSTDGSYRIETCPGQSWGSQELVGVLYTVAKRWKELHPRGRLNIGDLNAFGHKSHNWGRAVDLDATTTGSDWVADFTKGNYNRSATIELGKLFVDTNLILNIWYNDQAVNNEVLAYSRATGKSLGMNMKPIVGHNNHFHVDINTEKLGFWVPGC